MYPPFLLNGYVSFLRIEHPVRQYVSETSTSMCMWLFIRSVKSAYVLSILYIHRIKKGEFTNCKIYVKFLWVGNFFILCHW